MKKIISFVLALMMFLSICSTSLAAIECTNWIDTGAVTTRECTSGGCGIAWWWSVMQGTKQQTSSP